MTDKILLVIMRLQKDFERGFTFVVPEDRVKSVKNKKKELTMKKKIHWGVLAWVCAEIAFFLTLAVVVAFVILNAIAGATSGGVTLFTNWWQTVLFIADVLIVACLVFCAVMYFTKGRNNKKEVEENEM